MPDATIETSRPRGVFPTTRPGLRRRCPGRSGTFCIQFLGVWGPFVGDAFRGPTEKPQPDEV